MWKEQALGHKTGHGGHMAFPLCFYGILMMTH